MGKGYKIRKQEAIDDVAKWAAQHVIKEEPVRSFRFHGHYTDKKYDKGAETVRPGFITFTPTQSVKFAYTSTYCFTLTWTPGHMTIVGDLGELTVVHYNAMPTLEAACDWLQSSDYDYLLSKTKVSKAFDREQTVDDLWRLMIEELPEQDKYYAQALDEHAAERPKWRKRDGMSKADYEQELKCWEEDHPRINYGFRETKRPSYLNKNLWSEEEEIGWTIPEGYRLIARAWHDLHDGYYGLDSDPNSLMTPAGRQALNEAIHRYCCERSDEEIGSWCYRTLDMDWSGVYEYPHQAFTQIAAIQHGVRMIEGQLFSRKEAA